VPLWTKGSEPSGSNPKENRLDKKRLLILVLAMGFMLAVFAYAETALDKYKEAQKLMPEAKKLIDQGKLDESLKILRQALAIAPKEPDMHMNYASVLFIKGQQFFQFGFNDNAKKVFKETEDELITAIKLYKSNPSKDINDRSKSQCYFLLGDIYYYVYENKMRAKSLYQKAIEYNPEHAGAAEALKKIPEPK
jgi:tetratricopeptide (TPR) repeat protein